MYALKCRLLNFFSDCEKNTHKHKKEEKIYSSCQFSAVTKAQNRAPFGWFEWLIFDWSAKRIVFLSSTFYSFTTLLLYTVFLVKCLVNSSFTLFFTSFFFNISYRPTGKKVSPPCQYSAQKTRWNLIWKISKIECKDQHTYSLLDFCKYHKTKV
jgi:hypothetical protein